MYKRGAAIKKKGLLPGGWRVFGETKCCKSEDIATNTLRNASGGKGIGIVFLLMRTKSILWMN